MIRIARKVNHETSRFEGWGLHTFLLNHFVCHIGLSNQLERQCSPFIPYRCHLDGTVSDVDTLETLIVPKCFVQRSQFNIVVIPKPSRARENGLSIDERHFTDEDSPVTEMVSSVGGP